jgi:hypothetical protein
MPKIHPKLSEIEFEDEKIVESIERVITAIQLLEARGRTSENERALIEELEAENTELKNKNDKLKTLIKQQQIEVIRIFEKSN